MDSTTTKYITYIHDNIDDLRPIFKKEILQIILYSNIDEDKIVEKGNGTQIKFLDLDPALIKNIYNYIYKKIQLSFNIV